MKPAALARLRIGLSQLTAELREARAPEHELFAAATGVVVRLCNQARRPPQRRELAAPARRRAVR